MAAERPQPPLPPKKAKETPSRKRSLLLRIAKFVAQATGVAAALLGVVTGYIALVPKVSVFSSESLNPSNPMITPFVVVNEGPLGINDLKVDCLLNKITIAPPQGGDIEDVMASWNAGTPRMFAGERTTYQCYYTFNFKSPMATGDIQISITFRPDYWPWRKTRVYRFVTWTNKEGKLIWLPKANSETEFVQEK